MTPSTITEKLSTLSTITHLMPVFYESDPLMVPHRRRGRRVSWGTRMGLITPPRRWRYRRRLKWSELRQPFIDLERGPQVGKNEYINVMMSRIGIKGKLNTHVALSN